MSDYRDLVIEEFADSEAELRERVASLEADVQSYSALAKEALHHLYETNTRLDRAAAVNRRLHAALRDTSAELARIRQELEAGRAA